MWPVTDSLSLSDGLTYPDGGAYRKPISDPLPNGQPLAEPDADGYAYTYSDVSDPDGYSDG